MEQHLPHNAEAERELLGAILNNNDGLIKIDGILLAEHFFLPMHQRIYEIIQVVVERGYSATPVVIKSYFDNEEAFKSIEGGSQGYLMQLMAEAQLINDVISLAKIIHDHYVRRKIIDIGGEMAIQAKKYDEVNNSARNCIEHAEQRLYNLAVQGRSDEKIASLKQAVTETITRIHNARNNNRAISGVTSGFIDMDGLTGGLQPSDLIIIAARPSMGKTSLAITIALNAALAFRDEAVQAAAAAAKNKDKAAKTGGAVEGVVGVSAEQSVAVFSLEMSSEQIATRILSIRTKIDSSRLRMGHIQKEEFEVMSREVGNISNLQLYIDDTPALSIAELRARARRLKRQKNIGLLLIDYLQLLRGSTSLGYNNRVQEIGEISQGLKAIAKELSIPVIALSQLSRAVESRDDKRPMLSDLRESGNIEQDADIVAFIYREEYYLGRKMPNEGDKHLEWQDKMMNVRNQAEIIIAKHRNGPIGTFNLHFDSNTTGFGNLAHVDG